MSVYEEKVEFVVICFCRLTAPRVKCCLYMCILGALCAFYLDV